MYNRNTERARPAQCTYVMQPPTLRNHPSIQNKRFNDREMLAFFNDQFEAVETARKENTHKIFKHGSSGSLIKKNPVPFSEVLNEAYANFNK